MKYKYRMHEQIEQYAKLKEKFKNTPIPYKEEKNKKRLIVVGLILVIICFIAIKLI